MATKPTKVGIDIQALIRDTILAEVEITCQTCHEPLGILPTTAQRIADQIAEQINGCEWVSLSNGTTFDFAFDPSPRYDDLTK